jgi:hypothetical protein
MMLVDAAFEVSCYPGVQDGVTLIGQNVNAILSGHWKELSLRGAQRRSNLGVAVSKIPLLRAQ